MWQMSDKYVDFFREARDERVLIMQGSRRSGKTTNTFLFLYGLSKITDGLKYTTLTYQYPQLAKTMADFEKCTGCRIKRTKEGYTYRDSRGNLFLFDHCDDTSKALGNDCDLLFMNESVNIPEEIADNYMLGCTGKVLLNFNPIHHAWHDKYLTRNNLLKTTFKDNEYLTESQIMAFERLRERAESPIASPLDIFNYEVYYCGNYSNISGSVFTDVKTITYQEYVNLDVPEYFGMDFGFRAGGDATSIVGVKLHNKTIYAHLYLYDNSLERLEDLYSAMTSVGMTSNIPIFADYGGMGRSRMDDLIYKYSLNMQDAIKPKIMDNISRMLSFEGGLRITENSDAMLREIAKYELINGRLSEKNNHSIDALRYAFNAAAFYE